MTPRDADRLAEFLRAEGAPDAVVHGGLEVLLSGWERTVGAVEAGYPGDYEDYLADLDGRQLLAQALSRITRAQAEAVAARLEALDLRMRAATTPVARCVWGAIVADEEGWTAEGNWWYFVRPLTGRAELLGEFPGDCFAKPEP
ncbi:MAG TPA: hypothetical protein PK948_08970 [Gemmatimonadales bacterium]|nr:hypothetical protein [Gemmatimonadales bacterium]